MDEGTYRQILHQCFPGLNISSIQFIGGGTFRVFEVSSSRFAEGNLVFRFPHGGDSEELLRRERHVCAALNPILPLPIPRYTHYTEGCALFDKPVAGYRKIPGMALQDCAFDQATLRQVATQIGGFLSALHSTARERMRATGVPFFLPHQLQEGQRGFYAEIQRHAYPLLSTAERAWTEALFEPFLADEANWQFRPVLVHGDLDGSNILCDQGLGRVAGIIDFEEANFGDPASDFVLVAEFGSQFLQDLVAAYRPRLDARTMQRVAFHAQRILFHELLYGIQEGEQRFIDHGLKRLGRAMAGQEPIGGWLAVSTSETRNPNGFAAQILPASYSKGLSTCPVAKPGSI